MGNPTTFTPTLTQGVGITSSAASGTCFQLGRVVFFFASFTANSAGTAGQAIILGGLPIAGQALSGLANGIYVSSVITRLIGSMASAPSVSLAFFGADNGASNFGVSPAVTVTSGDSITVSGWYAAA